jgi:hypothetical protein
MAYPRFKWDAQRLLNIIHLMRRWLWNITATFSLVLFLCSSWLWIRTEGTLTLDSYSVRGPYEGRLGVAVISGSIVIWWESACAKDVALGPNTVYLVERPPPSPTGFFRRDPDTYEKWAIRSWQFVADGKAYEMCGIGWKCTPAISPWRREYFVSLLLFALLFSLMPGVATLRAGRRRLRKLRGLCPTCGYDLIGNISGVCPECGSSISVEHQ